MKTIVKFNPTKTLMELRKVNSVELCLHSDTPALSVLKKENGEDKVLTMLEMWIVDINEFFNVNHKMTPAQIKETSIFLLEDYYYFKIADINYIFSNAKKGRYGNLYGSLDGAKIYGWFEKHDVERAQRSYNEALKLHDIEMSRDREAKSLVKESKIGKEIGTL
jgi:hypothetical protein